MVHPNLFSTGSSESIPVYLGNNENKVAYQEVPLQLCGNVIFLRWSSKALQVAFVPLTNGGWQHLDMVDKHNIAVSRQAPEGKQHLCSVVLRQIFKDWKLSLYELRTWRSFSKICYSFQDRLSFKAFSFCPLCEDCIERYSWKT